MGDNYLVSEISLPSQGLVAILGSRTATSGDFYPKLGSKNQHYKLAKQFARNFGTANEI